MDKIMDILIICVILLLFFIGVLVFIYWYLSIKEKKHNEEEEKVETGTTTKTAMQYTKKSIFKREATAFASEMFSFPQSSSIALSQM